MEIGEAVEFSRQATHFSLTLISFLHKLSLAALPASLGAGFPDLAESYAGVSKNTCSTLLCQIFQFVLELQSANLLWPQRGSGINPITLRNMRRAARSPKRLSPSGPQTFRMEPTAARVCIPLVRDHMTLTNFYSTKDQGQPHLQSQGQEVLRKNKRAGAARQSPGLRSICDHRRGFKSDR